MANIERKTRVIEGYCPDTIPFGELMETLEPVVLKGLVKSWPLVREGLASQEKAIAYLGKFCNEKTVGVYHAGPEIQGRFFYNSDLNGLNFKACREPLKDVLKQIQGHLKDKELPSIYVGSTTIDACLPAFRRENDLTFNDAMFDGNPPLASIWLGLPSLASAHYDMPNNLACCLVGRRRFTLFPPEQIANLYPGPLEPTPGGQVVSMVDMHNPDFNQHPRFREAISAGQIAELAPGDALFYPSMWWHQVESLNVFNVMVNYWWNTSPKYMSTPMNVLKYGLLSLRDRPEHEKLAWKAVFDYYLFGSPDLPRAHLPEEIWGDLGAMDNLKARKLRAFLINSLNR